MDFVEERQVLSMWAEKRGRDGIEVYWEEKNPASIDGKPTGIRGLNNRSSGVVTDE